MKINLTDAHADELIDDSRTPPTAVYRYLADTPDDGIGPNGVEIALFADDGRAAITGGGDWLWGDYNPATEDADDLLDLYLRGDWEARN